MIRQACLVIKIRHFSFRVVFFLVVRDSMQMKGVKANGYKKNRKIFERTS